jgi:hypothetical protein
MRSLPRTANPIVLRTWFADDGAWRTLCEEIQRPAEFLANVDYVDDVEYDGASTEDVVRLAPHRLHSCIFIADRTAQTAEGRPLVVVDLGCQAGRSFRVVVPELWGVENNLSLANMDFEEFADHCAPDGVFRGF